MSKTITIKLSSTSLPKLLLYIGQQLSCTDNQNPVLEELKVVMCSSMTQANILMFNQQIESWWTGQRTYLVVNCADKI